MESRKAAVGLSSRLGELLISSGVLRCASTAARPLTPALSSSASPLLPDHVAQVWTGYEVAFMHWWATDRIPWVADGWWAHGAYNTALLLAIPFWREFHFYVVHRALHWGPLYRAVHSLHHKSANPTPWSGLSMHPVELLGYFSVLLIHCVVPSHPLHVIFNAQHTALTPASGHSGYHPPVLGGVPMGSYFHYLHHRYLSVNFGEATLPLDWMFGTFRDGGAEGGDAAVAGGGAPGKGSARKAKRVD